MVRQYADPKTSLTKIESKLHFEAKHADNYLGMFILIIENLWEGVG
jgi:hypothetical protein